MRGLHLRGYHRHCALQLSLNTMIPWNCLCRQHLYLRGFVRLGIAADVHCIYEKDGLAVYCYRWYV